MGYSKTWLYISTANQQLRHRRVKHFGYEFLYGTNNVDKSNPLHDGIPSVCDVILERIQQHVAFKPDQMTVNEYKPGQGRKNPLTLNTQCVYCPHPSPYTSSFFALCSYSPCFLFIFGTKERGCFSYIVMVAIYTIKM